MALTEQNIQIISDFLKFYTAEHNSIKFRKLFDTIQHVIDLSFDKFKIAVNYLITSNRIEGYTILPDGLIYPEDKAPPIENVIKDSYGCFRLKSRSPQDFKQLPVSEIVINSENIKVGLSQTELYSLLMNVFKIHENVSGEIVLVDKSYSCDNVDVLRKFLTNFCPAN